MRPPTALRCLTRPRLPSSSSSSLQCRRALASSSSSAVLSKVSSKDDAQRSFRLAIANGEREAAQHAFLRLLESPAASKSLRPRDVDDFSSQLQSEHNERIAKGLPLRPETRGMAIYLARLGYPRLLGNILATLVATRPEAVVELWSSVCSGVLPSPFPASSSSPLPTPPRLDPSIAKKLETSFHLVILAYASLNKHSQALQSIDSFPSSVHLSLPRFERVLSRLHLSSELREKAIRLFEDIQLVRTLHGGKPSSFLAACFEKGDVDAAMRFIRGTIRGMDEGWISLPPSPSASGDPSPTVSSTTTTTVPEILWSVALSNFMRAGRPDVARHLWSELTRLHIPLTSVIWNALLEGYSQRGQMDDLMRVWGTMKEQGVQRDVFSYTTMISALFEAKMGAEAVEMWNELRGSGLLGGPPSSASTSTSDDIPQATKPSVVPYNAVLHGLLISARSSDAQALFSDMQSNGPAPDITTINTFIRHYSRKGDLSSIASLLRQLPSLHIAPDVFTFTSVLHACLRAGIPSTEAVQRVERAMEQSGIEPNVVTYSAIIDQIVRQGGMENIRAGFAWLDALEQRGLRPNEVTYTTLLAALQRDVSLPRSFVEREMAALTRRMSARGARRNRVTYNVLIKASLAHAGEEGMQDALGYYEEMTREGSGIKANDDTWYLLIHGALTRGDKERGRWLLEEMERVGFVPTGALERAVNRLRSITSA